MKIPKILDKILTVIGYALTILPYLFLGAYAADTATGYFPEENTGGELIIMGLIILIAVLFLYVHIIIHEGGHLICGLLSGWKYSSFRVGNLTLVKQDDKIKCKKTTVAGTGGQCLMTPPECEPEKCPFFLYLLGGGLLNIITGGIALLIAFYVNSTVATILTVFAVMGIGLGVSNLFPAKMGGTMNDGYQIFIEMPGNPKSKASQYCLLASNAVLTNSESTDMLPEKLRNTILDFDYSDLGNTGTANLYLYKATILFENGRYDEVKDIYERVNESPDTIELFKKEARCELIYLEIMGDCNAEKIEKLADKKQMEYIKATALYPSRKRLMYAYYLIYKNDTAKAEDEYKALVKTAESHPVKAEGAIDLKEAERVKKHYENRRDLQNA